MVNLMSYDFQGSGDALSNHYAGLIEQSMFYRVKAVRIYEPSNRSEENRKNIEIYLKENLREKDDRARGERGTEKSDDAIMMRIVLRVRCLTMILDILKRCFGR